MPGLRWTIGASPEGSNVIQARERASAEKPVGPQVIDTERIANRTKSFARDVDVATHVFEQIANTQRVRQTIG